ncbi:uncharacterized protein M6B38_292800 [Iris pallida]|uniref:Uncharacterized protein n=1 Tax=Iris pallida TaxID=29817 RepID=A0AAX6HTV7_IRIPA|nr:uncharacterized protein M6B38_292800 [Iris pallida]
MKAPHVTGEGTWGHQMKLVIREKLRKAYDAAVVRKGANLDISPEPDGVCRWTSGSGLEDPIRRVMFLGPWSHT